MIEIIIYIYISIFDKIYFKTQENHKTIIEFLIVRDLIKKVNFFIKEIIYIIIIIYDNYIIIIYKIIYNN